MSSDAMHGIDTALPELSKLIEQRIELMRNLAVSLAASSLALVGNDAEGIARGAAHQAELCRQWSHLEDELRRQSGCGSAVSASGQLRNFQECEQSERLQADWEMLAARIGHLTRVHWSLLRHLERSLAIVNRVVVSCATTYAPPPGMLSTELRLRAAESSCQD
jgi:hypothetical protein